MFFYTPEIPVISKMPPETLEFMGTLKVLNYVLTYISYNAKT